MSEEDRENAFLAEYKSLCEKYKITVSACGCCNGPWLVDHENNNTMDVLHQNVDHLKGSL